MTREFVCRYAVDPSDSLDIDREISEADIDAHLMTTLAGSPPLDILIRTSGVKRLSDFMLWQVSISLSLNFLQCDVSLVFGRYANPVLLRVLA